MSGPIVNFPHFCVACGRHLAHAGIGALLVLTSYAPGARPPTMPDPTTRSGLGACDGCRQRLLDAVAAIDLAFAADRPDPDAPHRFTREDGQGDVTVRDSDRISCPFCDGWICLTVEPAGALIHSAPTCERFDQLDPDAFMRAAVAAELGKERPPNA